MSGSHGISASNFSPYNDSYQSSRPPNSVIYELIDADDASSPISAANPFANASYRSPDDGIHINKYETSLPIRIDMEAALTYMLGCVTGVLFLILEQKNDYIRFHAWQSCLVFIPLTICFFVVVWFSSFLAWLIFFAQTAASLFLQWQAYQNGLTLERYEVPIVGRFARQWVDKE